MNLAKKRIDIAFILTLLATLLFPWFHIYYFVPFLIIIIYQKSLHICLWYSLLCGLILDLLSSNMLLGMQSLNFCITTGIIFQLRQHFFSDNLSTLPLMTFFYSSLSTAIHLILLNTLEKQIALTGSWILTDIIILPFLDSLFGFVVFILPYLLLGKRPRKGKDYFAH